MFLALASDKEQEGRVCKSIIDFEDRWPLAPLLIAITLPLEAQPAVDWPGVVRTLVSAHQMDRAMKTTEEWIGKYPEDLDARAWHARILGWQGHASESEEEFGRC